MAGFFVSGATMSFTNPAQLGGQNVAAFLDMLARSEGTSTSPATKCDGYDVIVYRTGIDRKPEIFTDFSDAQFFSAAGHPR